MSDDDLECNVCSMEFHKEEITKHVLQHFKQSVCSECGEILIKIGNIWYGPHNCSFEIAEISTEMHEPEEILLPDFIEVKSEEIYDVDELEYIENDDYENVYCEEKISSEDDIVKFDKVEKTVADQKPNKKRASDVGQWSLGVISHKSLGIQIPKHNGPNRTKRSILPSAIAFTHLTEEQLANRQCPICDKIIVNKQNLICHMNIHKGEKPFECTVCNKSFAHIRNLVRHKEQQGHCDLEYTCTRCKKKFMSSNKLQRHINQEHSKYKSSVEKPNDNLFPCSVCDRNFKTLGFLNMHMRRHRHSGYTIAAENDSQ